MSRHRLLQKGKSKPNMIFAITIGANVFLGVLIYALFSWVLSQPLSRISMRFKVVVLVVSILIPTVIQLSLALLSGVKKDQVLMVELKKFKNFIDALYHASTDIEAYDILRDFIAMAGIADKISLVYKASDHENAYSWQGVSADDAAVCDMRYDFCPLIIGEKDYVCGNPDSQAGCPLDTKKFRKGSYFCLPVFSDENYQSILQLYRCKDNPFDQTAITTVKSYVEIARPVIASKRTLSILNKKATTDYLTKLYNRDFLETYLQNQIEVSNLSKQPLSIIMIDVDCFKNINDTYGHASGDYLLIHFSEIVMKCVRKTDVVVRYGGDEFIVILPSTDTKTAIAISERIRCNLEKSMIRSIDGNNMLFATCSLGISTYPILCSSKDELLKTADIALYKAKRSYKNCTMVYEKDLAAI